MLPLMLILACAPKAPPDAPSAGGSAAVPSPEPAPAAATAPASLAESVTAALDPAVDPCQDFYAYACGGWTKSFRMPGDQVSYTRGFSDIHDRNQLLLRGLLEEAAAGGEAADWRKIGDAYAACTDTAARDAAGIAPLAPALAEIAAIDDPTGVMSAAGHLQLQAAAPFVSLWSDADFKDPSRVILYLSQGGLGLPDREYYLGDDEESVALRATYRDAVAQMLAAAGEADPEGAADRVLAFETRLAIVQKPQEELRDPQKTYNRIDRAGLVELAPDVAWDAFFAALGISDRTDVSVEDPEYVRALGQLVGSTGLDTLRPYLRWHLVSAAAPNLGADLGEQHYAFFGKALTGQAQQKPLWKRCVASVDAMFPEIVGKYYVERAFPGDSKAIALDMIHGIEAAFAANLPSLAWMDDATRARALEKMQAIDNKIGFPDQWRDYGAVAVDRGAHYANVSAATQFESLRQLQKVGRPVDRGEWYMSPPTVNAYYNPGANEIVFPAGILQPPFFDRSFPAALNFGAIGMVMGHEVTHGFDDEGRKFDGTGLMTEWWAPEVAVRFEERAACVVSQYDAYEVLPGVNVSGELTLGENIADLGGIKESWLAYKAWKSAHPGPDAVPGLTDDQLFFIGYAQGWCTLRTPEIDKMYATVDPHAPPRFRVNGPLANLPAFAETFGCAAGAPMVREAPCEVW